MDANALSIYRAPESQGYEQVPGFRSAEHKPITDRSEALQAVSNSVDGEDEAGLSSCVCLFDFLTSAALKLLGALIFPEVSSCGPCARLSEELRRGLASPRLACCWMKKPHSLSSIPPSPTSPLFRPPPPPPLKEDYWQKPDV
ncbi:hypothetical protein NQZ68_014476 [Dissostichus eleginoides]|nr:hypothetical protein NQZ68_014476 [Dissostichus eleginoides]